MKKSIFCMLLAGVILATSACGLFSGNVGTYSDETMDYDTAEKTAIPNSSDTADGEGNLVNPTPTQTVQVYERKVVNLKKGVSDTVNGYTVRVDEATNDEGDFVYAVCEGQTVYISDGYFEKAYLCARETGKTALVVCAMGEDVNVTKVYRLNREKKSLFYEMSCEYGKLVSISDVTVRIASTVDFLGTWFGERDYTLTETVKSKELKLEPVDNLWVVEADESRYLTALCDVRAREYDTGKDTAILEGSVVVVVMVDADSNYAILKDVESEFLYKVYGESDGHGGFLLEDVGAESGCFDNIRYSG